MHEHTHTHLHRHANEKARVRDHNSKRKHWASSSVYSSLRMPYNEDNTDKLIFIRIIAFTFTLYFRFTRYRQFKGGKIKRPNGMSIYIYTIRSTNVKERQTSTSVTVYIYILRKPGEKWSENYREMLWMIAWYWVNMQLKIWTPNRSMNIEKSKPRCALLFSFHWKSNPLDDARLDLKWEYANV